MTGSTTSKARVVVADDHPMVRDGIVALLDSGGFDVVGEAGDSEQAIAICEVRRPDLLLLDYELPPGDAPVVIVAVREQLPELRILVFTAFQDAGRARAVLEIGADGFVTKGLRGPELIEAATRTLAGEQVIAPEIAQMIGKEPAEPPGPSERQRAVVEAVARGGTNRDIAEELGITERTVKYHLRAVFDRLGASNRAEAVARASEAGWF